MSHLLKCLKIFAPKTLNHILNIQSVQNQKSISVPPKLSIWTHRDTLDRATSLTLETRSHRDDIQSHRSACAKFLYPVVFTLESPSETNRIYRNEELLRSSHIGATEWIHPVSPKRLTVESFVQVGLTENFISVPPSCA